MTILVTGGAGFIGSNFVLDWFAQGADPELALPDRAIRELPLAGMARGRGKP